MNGGEFCGGCFSLDGKTFFVNQQGERTADPLNPTDGEAGLTYAIWGSFAGSADSPLVCGGMPRIGAPLAATALAVLVVRVATLGDGAGPELAAGATAGPAELARMGAMRLFASSGPHADGEPAKIPSAAGLRRAGEFAGSREGYVSFAVVNTEGKLRGRTMGRLYPAASVVKAMLLAAEVRRLAGTAIDDQTDSLLRAMVTSSDNDAADAIYSRVGDAGLNAVAKKAGMSRFTVAGHWGNAQIAAGDMALLFADLDDVFPSRRAAYAKGLLGSVVAEQRWGIPVAAGEDWAVRFKGGWLPDKALVNQAAELREVGGQRTLAIAVLTDAQPSHEYGVATVRGVAGRLLDR